MPDDADYCHFEGCMNWIQAKGYCNTHLKQVLPEVWKQRRVNCDLSYQKARTNPEYREKRRLDKNRTATAMMIRWREDVISHYSLGINKCACCREGHKEFLSIDHINGRGTNDDFTGYKFYRWLIVHNYPEGYRVLCHNCNQANGYYGYCPHQKESDHADRSYSS